MIVSDGVGVGEAVGLGVAVGIDVYVGGWELVKWLLWVLDLALGSLVPLAL